MRRLLWISLTAVLVLAAAPPTRFAEGGVSYAFSTGHDDFGWAIVDGGNTSMSGSTDLDPIDDLKDEFGDRFLYLRDGEDRYVIRDRESIARAQKAARSIQAYGKEIGAIARAKVHHALGDAKHGRRQAALARKRAALDREIANRARRGESTDRLEAQMEALDEAMESLDEAMASVGTYGAEDDADSQDLDRRSEQAKKRLKKAVREIQEEMRDILRDAKARRLATRLD